MAIVKGTDSSEVINKADGVTDGADTIYGYGGNDDIFGFGGNDNIIGGAGADDIDGGADSDTVLYTDSTAAVTVSLASGTGDGGTADGDTLTSIENVYGSNFDDTLVGNGGVNALSGLQGKDLLKGGGGADTLSGGSGDDTLKGGGGADTLSGGTDIDTASYIGSSAAVAVSLLEHTASGGEAAGDVLTGIENLTGTGFDDFLEGDDGDNVLNGGDGHDTLHGEMGNDTLNGGDGNDYLVALNGDDEIYAGPGNDKLYGGFGDDLMVGGTGNDHYAVNDAGDVVVELPGEGIDDVVTTRLNFVLPEDWDIEELAVALSYSTTAANLTGNGLGNTITGNDGHNVLDGGAGADSLIGLLGNDTYIIDNPADAVTEDSGEGQDEARTSVSWTLTAGAEVETLRTTNEAATDAINLTGNSKSNTVRGNAGSNVLSGGEGNDTLTGLGGPDTFVFSSALNPQTNIDAITDFNVVDDTIWLDDDIFTGGLTANNSVGGSQFVIGPAALDAGDRIIYNSATGAVSYDSDGTGATAAVQFATLSPGLALTNFDFFVVG